MKTHSRFLRYTAGSELLGEATDSVSGDGQLDFDASIPGTTNQEVDLAFLKTKVVSFCVYASGGVTLFTNADDGAGGDELAIPAGLTVWNTNDLTACPFTEDVAKLFIDNAASTAVSVKIAVLIDSTP